MWLLNYNVNNLLRRTYTLINTNNSAVAKEASPPEPKKEETKPETEPEAKPADSKPAPINPKTYHPRLGLARAYRAAGDVDQSKKFYNEVMAMAPEVGTCIVWNL